MIGAILLLLAANGLLQALLQAGSPELQDDPMRLLGRLIGVAVFGAGGAILVLLGVARRRAAAEEARLRGFCATEAVSARPARVERRPGPRRTRIFATATLFVDVERTSAGDIVFHGQDLAYPFGGGDVSEYEYSLTVPAVETEILRRALRGGAEEDLIDLLVRNGDSIVQQGEQRWLQSLGIEPELWNRIG